MDQTRRHFLRQVGGAAAMAAASPALGQRAAGGRKPNIVYIMSDELGYYELSCMGNPNIKTPTIDRVASEGVRFTQGLAGSSVCAPTRCCLMTGKHSGHTSVRTNGGGTPMREGEETVASILKREGYATGGFGKWGCGGRGSTGVPEDHGFDVFVGYYDQVHAHSYYPAYIVRNSEEMVLPGNRGGNSGETYAHYAIMDEGLKFIRDNKDQPFFCYLPITPPHGMFDIPADDPAWQMYKDEPWSDDAKAYAAMVSMVDRNVKDVLDLLGELSLEDDTIVFFCGDNGGNDYFRDDDHPRGLHGANVDPRTGTEFRGRKGNLYEGGLRIPMMARWPGRIQPGRVSDLLWYFPDVLPTVAELTSAPVRDDIDGMSIVPELLGEATVGRKQEQHEYLYWELNGQTAVRMGTWKAVLPRNSKDWELYDLRTGTWKAVLPRNSKDWELYDLRTDISEANNIATQQADVLAKMTAMAEDAHEEAVEGVFHDTAMHERDRQAKWGDTRPPQRQQGAAANTLPQEGLIPRKDWKLARVSSESRSNGKPATNAFDGNPSTWWHTSFQGGADKHPHELVIDLGREYTVRGFRYLARQDNGWNGTIKDCEFYVGASPDEVETLAAKATLRKVKKAQEVKCKPVRGRYVLLRALSEVNDGPWASAAELGVIGE